MKNSFRDKGLWFLFFLGILYFHAPLFSERIFFFRDLILSILQRKYFLSTMVKAGHMPLWNPFVNGGQSFWAYNFPLYPLNILYVLLPIGYGCSTYIVLHFLLCSIFAYFLAKGLQWSTPSCVLVGIIYGYSGWTLSHGNLNALAALPYLPLLLGSWHAFLKSKRHRWFVITVVAGVFQVLSGSPENNILSMLLMLIWTLCLGKDLRQRSQHGSLWFLACLFILWISAIQILPTAEMTSISPRGEGLSYNLFAHWSLSPRRIPELIFPSFCGSYDRLPLTHCWGWRVNGPMIPYVINVYIGIPVLILAYLGTFRFGSVGKLIQKLRWCLAAIFVLSIVGSLGKHLPGFHLIYDYVPGARMFRYPMKILGAGILPLALLAGAGLELYFPISREETSQSIRHPTISSSLLVAAGLLSAALLLLFLGPMLLPSAAASFHESYFNAKAHPLARYGMLLYTGHAAWATGCLAGIFRWARKRWSPYQTYALIALVAFDLLWAGRHTNPTAKASFLYEKTPLISAILKETSDGQGRFYRGYKAQERPIFNIPDEKENLPHSSSIAWLWRWDFETLRNGTSSSFWIPTIFESHGGLCSLRSKRLSKFLSREDLSYERKLPILSTGSVRVILSDRKIDSAKVTFIDTFDIHLTGQEIYLYRNPLAAPWATFVSDSFLAKDDFETIRKLTDPSFDPRSQVILQDVGDDFHPPSTSPFASDEENLPKMPPRVEVSWKEITHQIISVQTDRDGYLSFSEPLYPGWIYTVDGQEVTPVRANYIFTAIPITAGQHEVVRRYQPSCVRKGILLSLSGILLLASLLCISAWTRWHLLKPVP